ncbi:MAG: TonB-dependent receptor, partial [Terriglobia bacterium]
MKSVCKVSLLLPAFFMLLTAAPLYPQSGANGAISGFVTDPSGAAVVGVTVKATNVNTGVSYRAGTTTDGYYTINFLIPGTYRVEVAQPGFKTAVVNNVVVQTASNPTVNIALTLGAVAQTVTVTDTTSLVEMQRADGGAVVDTKRVDDVPTMQRNATSLLYTAASVLPTSTEKTTTLEDVSKSSSQSINGSVDGIQNGFTETNDVLVDGVENRVSDSSSGSFIGYIPSQEAVGEVKVVTNPFSAEYGRTLGGVDSYTTKSGTNQFHGQAFEYNREFGLSSTLFDSNRAIPTVGKTPLLVNTPGGQIGGPLLKNKLFGFFSYEYMILHTAVVEHGYVPTAKMRQGDFSQQYYGGTVASPTAITLYDPFSCPTTGTSTCTSRSVIGSLNDSVIPSSEMSPIAAALWNYIPLPNGTGLPITGFDNYHPNGTGAAPTDTDELVARVDYNINDKTRMTFRAIYEDWRGLPETFYNIANDAAELNAPSQRTDHNDLLNLTHTFSPTSVLDVRVGMERFIGGNPSSTYSCRASDTSWGFSAAFLAQASHCMPVFSFTSNSGVGGNYLGSGTSAFAGAGLSGNLRQPDYVDTLSGVFLKSLGRHTFKFGGQGFMERYYSANQGHNSGAFSFTPQATQQSPTAGLQASQGDSVASFDMGVGSVSLDVNSEPARQTLSAVWFVQDDIKVSRKLTINAGLRWDWDGGLTDRFNAMMANFNTTAVPNTPTALATQVAAAAVALGSTCPACANLVGGPTFPGANGLSRTAYDSAFTNFAPRLGAAYAFSPNTVVRAGWGLFYMPFIYDPGQTANGFSQTTSNVPFSSTNAVLSLITNPFPSGLLAATGSSLGLETNLGTALTVDAPQAREPRAQQFNFNVQHQLPHGILVTVGYNYNGASRLPVSLNLDHLSLAQTQLGYTYLNTSVPNPFAGLMPASVALNKATVAQSQLLLPYPQFTGVTENYIPIGNSAYHGFSAQVNKRFSSGLSFSAAYTNSKHMDRGAYMNPFDTQLMKEIDPLDVAQFLNLYGVYEFPLGRGKSLGSQMPGWANQIFGGWQLNWILRFQSG